ncbi:MAG: type I-E CRISPR-associated protein Cse1/CasA [Acutalibacteraceae bacterium]
MGNRECEFNLLDEPWIKVMKRDGTIDEVSILTVFEQAHLYTDLAGELATQNVAVLRLLLAVLHTVFSRVDEHREDAPIEETDDALERWGALWNANCFPIEPIKAYLHTQHEKFWLFHPERPFGQALSAAKGTEYSAAKLIGELSESSNKIRLFPPRTGKDKTEISYAESARWLLYVNGYDDTSAKPKGKNLPSPGAGWLGKLGLITAKGKTLFETLMLNLVLLKEDYEPWEPNVPAWELPKAREGERVEITIPDNPAALLTLQSRRLLLERNNDKVTGYRLLGGDFFSRENAFNETMTVWKSVMERGTSTGQYQPKRHDSSKQMWRDFASIVEQNDTKHLPGIVTWMNQLQKAKLLDKHQMVCFSIASVQYGDKDFFVTDEFSDSLTFYAELLTDAGEIWRTLALNEIQRCDQIANIVGRLARDLVKSAGGDEGDAASYRAKKSFITVWIFRFVNGCPY